MTSRILCEEGMVETADSGEDLINKAQSNVRASYARQGAALSLLACLGLAALAASGWNKRRVGRADMRFSTQLQEEDETTVSLKVIYRDFKESSADGGHPDFQPSTGTYRSQVHEGLVAKNLSEEGKPVFVECCDSPPCECSPLTTAENFKKWYVDDPTNIPVDSYIAMTSTERDAEGKKIFKFEQSNFFPLDTNAGWGDRHLYVPWNYYFTMEFRHYFVYHTGEYFQFRGDDDVWVFFNNKLALDLGGIHAQAVKKIMLDDVADALDLKKDETVMMHVFFAERSFSSSNFKIETNLQLDEDLCVEHDRLNLVAEPTDSDEAGSSLSWTGEAFLKGAHAGTPVTLTFQCEGGNCNGATGMGVINLPAITVPAGKSVVLTMEMTPDVAELELSNVHMTFYDLEDGRSVAVENPEKFIYFKDAVEYTRKTVENDFETFAGSGAEELSDNPTVPSSPLTQGQKQKMVTITFSPEEVSSAKIKLENTGTNTGFFSFFMAPMVKCVPCDPPCPDFAPTEIAQTTTVTTTVSETTVTDNAADAASADTSQYECCFIGIEALGVAVICGTDKPWFKPWCPDPPASAEETGEYECCVVGGIACTTDKPAWKFWCSDPPARRV